MKRFPALPLKKPSGMDVFPTKLDFIHIMPQRRASGYSARTARGIWIKSSLELIPKPIEVIVPCSMRLERGSPSSPGKALWRDHTVENREERKPDAGRLRMFG